MVLKPIDTAKLRDQFNNAQPFRWLEIRNFLEDDFARACAAAYPSFDESRTQGKEFKAVNERRKVQITDSSKFPAPVKTLSDALASPEFLKQLEEITGIPKLLADDQLMGGGIHVTGPHGRLDVHVDFNYVEERDYHRRLNILIYMNPVWKDEWGGEIELWDREVKKRHHAFLPELNRCVLFETNQISYHGVSPVTCPPDMQRKSFAAYYYTREAPSDWKGEKHDTVFRARPEEVFRGKVLMPLETAQRRVMQGVQDLKKRVKSVIGR
jgi:Rps23 Pro-64 3,4-dihydroxylase Tpa1-like proline 4-hydroxylase